MAENTRQQQGRLMTKWEKWFAWYPVKLYKKNKYVYWKYIYRREAIEIYGKGVYIYKEKHTKNIR